MLFEAYIKSNKLGAIPLDDRNQPRWARIFPQVGLVGHLNLGLDVLDEPVPLGYPT
jgi:hypothetical protein